MIQSVHIDLTKQKTIETALKESEARYRAIIDLIPDGIIILDQGTIRICQQRLCNHDRLSR